MSYRPKTYFEEQFEKLAEEREQVQKEKVVQLFVSGNPAQQKIATEWLVESLEELDLEQYRRNRFLEKIHLIPVGRATKALVCASDLLVLFQTLPREKVIQALGIAAAQHNCFWELLCIGLHCEGISLDRFQLSADTLQVTVQQWDTPTAVSNLKKALKPITTELGILGCQAVLTQIGELAPHPALHQLLSDLKALTRRLPQLTFAQELRATFQALPKNDFPVPSRPVELLKDELPIPTKAREQVEKSDTNLI